MAICFSNVDVTNLVIGPNEKGNNGGQYRKVSYNGGQVKNIQLGESIHDTLRCAYGVEQVAQDQPNKFCIKVDAPEKLSVFIKQVDDMVVKSVNDSALNHRSNIRSGTMNDTLRIKLQPDTQILVTTLKEGNKISAPMQGTNDDIKPGSMVLPIVKFQGGVYFVEGNYGISIVATQILVVNGMNNNVAFNLGDIQME